MFFLAEILSLFFYYTFYRVLFESISSWGIFFIFQALHLASEWILYPLRASSRFYLFMEKLRVADNMLLQALGMIVNANGLNLDDWRCFIVLDFGIRCSILIASAAEIVIILVTLYLCPWIYISLKQNLSSLLQTLVFILVSVVLEIVNAATMNALFFIPRKLDVLKSVMNCFSNIRFSFICVIIASVLFINPMFAFTYDNTFADD
jgi:hypothetical protein